MLPTRDIPAELLRRTDAEASLAKLRDRLPYPSRSDVEINRVLGVVDRLVGIAERARPFVELEARLANSGMGKPGRGDAPALLAEIDDVLKEAS